MKLVVLPATPAEKCDQQQVSKAVLKKMELFAKSNLFPPSVDVVIEAILTLGTNYFHTLQSTYTKSFQ